MIRLVIGLVCVSLYLIGSGGYDLYVQSGTSRQPTTITAAELQRSVPANRHLVVTGGQPAIETAVSFYQTKWGKKVSGSEILFIPITPADSGDNGATPRILLRVTEDKFDAAAPRLGLSLKSIEGVRTTSLDLEDKARHRLVQQYGAAAVDQMIILDYHGSIGLGLALGKLAGGLVLLALLVVGFIFSSKPSANASAVPPVQTA